MGLRTLARNTCFSFSFSFYSEHYGIHYFARDGHLGRKEWGYRTYTSFNEGWTACARLCKEDRECLAWTLDTKYHHCHLRNARHNKIMESWYCLSGTHDCYTSAECY